MLINENKYDHLFKKYGEINKIDYLLLKAQVKQESRFDPLAENKKSHAKGLAQFMDRTWLEWEDCTPGIQDQFRDYDPFNPEDSIRVQAAYMRYLLNMFRQDIKKALAAYNWGMGHVNKLIIRHPGLSFDSLISELPLETKGYIRNILAYYECYKVNTAVKCATI